MSRVYAVPLPPDLAGPVDVALAKPEESIPAEHAMRGGSVYELKWDGYRLVIVYAEQVRLWSRNGKDLTTRFPDIATAAAERVPPGTVLDGEVVIWHDGRLSFDLLQRRLVSHGSKVPALAREHPASFMGFDALASGGRDLRGQPRLKRRAARRMWRRAGCRRCS